LATVDDLFVPKTFYKWTDNDIAGEVPGRLGSSNVRFLTGIPDPANSERRRRRRGSNALRRG